MRTVRLALLAPLLAALAACAGGTAPSTTPGTAAPTGSTAGTAPARTGAYVDAMAREHAGHTPVANASSMEPRQEVVGTEVVYGRVGGRELRGYLARPASARPGAPLPSVVVIHEWWGLNDNVRMMTRRLAGEGYAALAVDMYGRVATTPEEARALMQGVLDDTRGGTDNLRAAATYLRAQGAPRVGVTGWCFGGAWTLQAALQMPELVDAAAMYYGRTVTDRQALARLDAPLLGLFGGRDEGIPVAGVREMERTLRELGKDVTVVVYDQAGHGFANPSGQAYNAAAADDAWRRTTGFFARHLQGGTGAGD